jgi:hypothetical protein
VGPLKNLWLDDSLTFSESPSIGRSHAGAQGTRSARVDRRANIELALKRSLIVERLAKIAQFEKDLGKR